MLKTRLETTMKPKPANRLQGRPAILKDGRSCSLYLPETDWAALDSMSCPNRSHAIIALLRERTTNTAEQPWTTMDKEPKYRIECTQQGNG